MSHRGVTQAFLERSIYGLRKSAHLLGQTGPLVESHGILMPQSGVVGLLHVVELLKIVLPLSLYCVGFHVLIVPKPSLFNDGLATICVLGP